MPDGLTLNGEGFYDGLGADNYKSYGGSIRLSIPLQRSEASHEAMKLGVKQDETTGLGTPSGDTASDGETNNSTSGRRQ